MGESMITVKLLRKHLRYGTPALAVLLLAGCVGWHPRPADDYVGFSPPYGVKAGETPPAPRRVMVPKTGPLEVGIFDAILLGLENYRALSVERYIPPIRRTHEDEERAAFDPVLAAELSASRVRDPARTPAGADTTTNSTAAGVGLSNYFPTGTDVSVDLSTNRTWGSTLGDQHTTRAGVTVTQALLRGLGLDVNLASLRQARLDTLSSEYELRGFAELLVADIESTYWDYALAKRSIEIYEESLKLARQQLSEIQQRIKVGKLAETELAAAQAEVALRQEALINARSALESTRLQLLRLTNPPGADRWRRDIVLKDKPAVPKIKLDGVEDHVKVALRMRPDLNQARLAVRRGDLEVVKTKNGLLPRLDFFITLGKTGYADSFGSSARNIADKHYDLSGGLRLEFPPHNRGAKAQHRRARLSRRQAAESVENLAQLVQVDVRSAYVEVRRTTEQVAATTATRKLQEEKLRAETEKFRVGKSTALLVAAAQRDLVGSQIAEIETAVAYLKALVDLHRLEGSLLERRGVSAPGRQPAGSVRLDP